MISIISIIIPLYNKENSIERSLRSVLTQSYTDYELIIVDDGSTDNSVDVVRKTLDSFSLSENKVQIILQENGGPSKARNTGVKHAQGEWIAFLDADDEIVPDALQLMIDKVEQYPDADIVDFNKFLRIDGKLELQQHPVEGRINHPLRAWYFRTIAPGCGHSIYRSSFIRQYPYDERIRRYEDGELLLRCLPQARVYSTTLPTEIHDMDTAVASKARKDICEDHVGHLVFMGKGFWHCMVEYRFFIEERDNYPMACHELYPQMYRRIDLLLLYKVLSKLKFLF